MTDNHSVAKKYASAAFHLAKKFDLIDQFLSDLSKITAIFSATIIKELSNPAISKPNLTKIVIEISNKLSLNAQVINFLKVVANARRIILIKEIEKNFATIARADKNILRAEVISATPIDDQQLKEIKSILQKKYFNSTIEINPIIKKNILGGLIIKIGSDMIDASFKSQLIALQNLLNQQISTQ